MSELLKLRRFWKSVRVDCNNDKYQILLDERPVKLPKKTVLYVENRLLAEKIAIEWENAGEKQGDTFSFNDLPMTRIAGTMIEKIAPNRVTYIDVLLPYVNGDLLCYHADSPQKLVNQQQEKWLPLLVWIEDFLKVKLKTHNNIMPITQEQNVIQIFKGYLSNLNDAQLTFFAILVPLLGSVILSIALKEKKITARQAFELAYLDEIIQTDIWGKDSEQEKRFNQIKLDIQEAFEFNSFFNDKCSK